MNPNETLPVTYLDLGPRDGEEIAAFLRSVRFVPGIGVRVHAIEANPVCAKQCRERFLKDRRVEVYNFAVGPSDGYTKFFLDPKVAGSSIYGDKGNVGEPINVPQRRFSSWLLGLSILPDTDKAINIIKANIEGAEWDLIQDMDQENLFRRFDICCGSGPRIGGWTGDMRKIPSILGFQVSADEILRQNGIHIEEWHGDCLQMYDMRGAIITLLREKGQKVYWERARNWLATAANRVELVNRRLSAIGRSRRRAGEHVH